MTKTLTDEEFRAHMDGAMQRVIDRVAASTPAALPEVPRDRRPCIKCQQDKPLGEFRSRKNRQGRTYAHRTCRGCMNAAERENRDRREKATARQRAARAAKSAELAISTEITALIQATTARSKTTPPPLPTAEELAAWHKAGCPVAPHQRRRAAA